MLDSEDRTGQERFPFTSRPDPQFTPHVPSYDDERPRERFQATPCQEDYLDEIQQEFAALSRWNREAESAARETHDRATFSRAHDTERGGEPDSSGHTAGIRGGSSSSSQDWRRILLGSQLGGGQHPRAGSDASVEVMDLETYARQLQRNRPSRDTWPSHAGRLSYASRPSTLESPVPSYTSWSPSATDPAPPFRSLESYRASMPRDDYYLPISDQRAPVYKPFSSKLFDAPVGHHVAAPGAEVENQPTRQALKSFPKFSRKWFNNDDVVSYEGIGHEEWAGGLTGDLAESAEPIAGSAASEAVKNARVRRLEREFGADREGGLTKAMFRATQPLQVGELNKRGFIVTSGPRKRSAFRWLEGLLSLLALILLIYSALFLKGIAPPPPPQSTAPAFVLYLWVSLALVAFLILHVIYPLSCLPRARKQLVEQIRPPSGGMVLPMSQSNGRSKRGGYGPPAPAINLIVDPRFFAPALSGHPKLDHQRRRSTSSSLSTSNSNLDDIKRYSRASFSDVLAARAEFSLARRWLTKLLVTDILIALGWASVFGFCMTGPACPAETSEKWCDCWNASLALAILLPLGHFASATFLVLDRKLQLHLAI